MISVDRSTQPVPPELLSDRVQSARAKLIDKFSALGPVGIEQSRIRFDASIWIAMKPALGRLFNDKCAYCESKLIDTQLIDVDHFRPKEGAESETGVSDYPYYGWLAYDWDNLLPSCSVCNRRGRSDGHLVGKGRLFPVTGNRAELLSSVEQCRIDEDGTLIDPCYDEPHDHLTFDEKGECVAKTSRGALSIGILGLNRSSLVRERLAVRVRVEAAIERVLDGLATGREQSEGSVAVKDLLAMTSKDAPYAGAARVFATAALEERLPLRDSSSGTHGLLLMLNWEFNAQRWTRNGVSNFYTDAKLIKQARMPIEGRMGMYEGRRMLPANPLAWVSKIEIENFKAIDHLELDIPAPRGSNESLAGALVLLGENAAGKSSVLEAITLALLGTDELRRSKIDGKKFVRRDAAWQEAGAAPHIKLHFNGADAPSCWLTIDPLKGEFHGTSDPQVVLLAYGPRRAFSDERSDDRADEREVSIFDCVRSLFHSTTTIPNPSWWLKESSERDFNAAIRALREVLMLKQDSLVTRYGADNIQDSGLSVDVHGTSTPLDRLSDGYRSVVAMTTDIICEMLRYWPDLESARGVVLIDEIDVHLHPRWKMRILRSLRAAVPGVQFIATTHDPLCLRGAYDGEVQVLQRDEANDISLVGNLPNVEGLTVEQLLTSDYFGMLSTENVDAEIDMARFVALASSRDRTDQDEAELADLNETLIERMSVGQTQQQQLLYAAANEFIIRKRSVARGDVDSLKRETLDKMIDIWSSLSDDKESS
ncbi:AAA family ATPase [Paraburkholderia sediminicola]|uniref:AAA family ATPase n=1 Tax=Paraburkholderia sediminicola TaxID=458836 RepID=UPI0038B7CE40